MHGRFSDGEEAGIRKRNKMGKRYGGRHSLGFAAEGGGKGETRAWKKGDTESKRGEVCSKEICEAEKSRVGDGRTGKGLPHMEGILRGDRREHVAWIGKKKGGSEEKRDVEHREP